MQHLGNGSKCTVTSLDSLNQLISKYGKSVLDTIATIQKYGGIVLHSVDATTLDKRFKSSQFDVVIFNFPHSGEQRVHINRVLIMDFFEACHRLFRSHVGIIHITVKFQAPYINWRIEESGTEAGFKLCKTCDFLVLPEYKFQTTVGPSNATSAPQIAGKEAGLAKTMVFKSIIEEQSIKQIQPDTQQVEIEELFERRNVAREKKMWKEADDIKTVLLEKYSVVTIDKHDSPSSWTYAREARGKRQRKSRGKRSVNGSS